MESPAGLYVDARRGEQVKVFRSIRPLDQADVVRGQMEGYLDEPGVRPGPTVETYAALKWRMESGRWHGAPFYIRAGKGLAVTVTEVMARLRPAALTGQRAGANYLRLGLSPELSPAVGV